MLIVAVEPLSSLAPEDRERLESILARHPFVRGRGPLKAFSLSRDGRRERVVAPAADDAVVGAHVESFGDLHASVVEIAIGSATPGPGLSLAGRLAIAAG